MITSKQFQSDALNAAVVRQMGGWTSFKESAEDIVNHGIDGGFHGFIYTVDTVKFGRKNRLAIRELLKADADDMGGTCLSLVAGFRCLNGDYSQDEIAACLYGSGSDPDADTAIYNALAWYAAECVARRFVDDSE